MDSEERERQEELARQEKIESELFFSIDRNEPERLAALLAQGIDPNTSFCGIDPLGKSLFWCPLHFCCEKGRRKCAELLLAAGANPDVGDRWCMTPLMYAIQTEWFDLAELMLNAGASVDLQDSRGRTPLSLAVDCSDDTAVKMLCAAGADVNVQDLVGRTPMWLAVCKDGHVTQLEALLNNKYGPSVCELNCADLREKRTAIQAAIVYAQTDRLQYVKMLLGAGSEVNHRDEANHNTLLNLLAKSRRLGHTQPASDELAIARLLLEAGYSINDVPHRSCWYKFGGTAIKMAAEQGATDLVKLFLEYDADPDIPDDCGVTPLLAACVGNHLAVCVALVQSNCNLDVAGDVKLEGVQRHTCPLQAAISLGHFAVGRLLLVAGASVHGKQLVTEDPLPAQLLEQDDACQFFQYLMDWLSTPPLLSDLCVWSIRRLVGCRRIKRGLDSLPLPTFLKNCVRLQHVLSDYNIT